MKSIPSIVLFAVILASPCPAQEKAPTAAPSAPPAGVTGEPASEPPGEPAVNPAADNGGAVSTTGGEVAVASPAVPTVPPGGTGAVASSENPSDATAPKKLDFLQRSNLILAKILENIRPTDPFGMPMDPANAPAIAEPTPYEEAEAPATVDSSALKDALRSLPITGVYPRRQILVLGPRTFRNGGEFGMKIDETTIRLRFDGIRDGEIFFTDMDTREAVSIPFNAKPTEFEPMGDQGKPAPGAGISSMNDLFIAD
ncbi:MAG: hypothetical protein KGR69_05470 [Verrucomicrobia bacterium]|nr:hypothetical protein [Verrucomicrobiota bacterium]